MSLQVDRGAAPLSAGWDGSVADSMAGHLPPVEARRAVNASGQIFPAVAQQDEDAATHIGCSGHRVIPPQAQTFVQSRLEEVLRGEWQTGNLVGVSSLAAGADQTFARTVLRLGGTLHAVLPSSGFEQTLTQPEDREEYQSLLRLATTVETLDFPAPSKTAYLAAGRRVVDLSNLLVAVWDGHKARGVGGTADVVGYAREAGKRVVVVWPRGVERD